MRVSTSSNIMPRTTLDIEAPILAKLKAVKRKEGKSLGQVVSELVAIALKSRRDVEETPDALARWISKPMGARVDLEDKDAVYAALDADEADVS